LGRAEHVIPVIVDGEPGNPARDCFAPALHFRLGPDGALTNEREEPIAADARAQGDGEEVARLKVVAGLLGIGLDEIVRRAERARRRGEPANSIYLSPSRLSSPASYSSSTITGINRAVVGSAD
jgi:hypothetical protein